MAEAMYKGKKIDIKIQKRELKIKTKLVDKRKREKKELVDKVERRANFQDELVILEAYERKVELQGLKPQLDKLK